MKLNSALNPSKRASCNELPPSMFNDPQEVASEEQATATVPVAEHGIRHSSNAVDDGEDEHMTA